VPQTFWAMQTPPLPQAGLQTNAWHAPPTQGAWFAHALPQALQFFESVARLASQPLLLSLSQLPKPLAQVMPQAPATQAADELAGTGKAFPHRPQFLMSVARLLSQPLLPLRSQSA